MPTQRADDKKGSRDFLGCRAKYPVPAVRSDYRCLFIDKLREKNRPPAQQEQVAYAVSPYFDMQRKPNSENPSVHVNAETTAKATPPSTLVIRDSATNNRSKMITMRNMVIIAHEPKLTKNMSPYWDNLF